jgi:hypothetical protein
VVIAGAQVPLRPVVSPDTRPYADGTVWVMEFSRLKEGAADRALERLAVDWRLTLEAARGEGLVVSYHVFHTAAATPRDWDLATMIEVKNMAVLDVVNARLGEIARPRADLSEARDILGTKIAREILLRPTR